jgi:heme exporter protein B
MHATGLLEAGRLLYARDLKLAFRRWEQITQPVVFFLMVTTLFPLALSPETGQLRQVAAGVLWVAALLSALLALEFMFRSDYEDGTLEQLVLSGQPLWWLALIKALAHWTVSGLPLVLAAPVVALSLAIPTAALGTVMVSLVLGTAILSFLGAVGAGLTLGIRRGSVLLSLLVLPLTMPALIFGARAVDMAVMGDESRGPLLLLGAMCILSVTLGPFATSAALKVSME